jgi:uncharacterized damage-inducible protein DinB
MTTVADLRDLFAYDAWANARLLAAVAAVPADQLTRGVVGGASSLRDTVSHIVVEEWIWLQRAKGENPTVPPAGPATSDREGFQRQMIAVQEERRTFLARLTDEELERVVAFQSLEGQPYRHRLLDLLLHVVNHSTYHRGQAAMLLRALGAVAPETDFVVYREGLAGR